MAHLKECNICKNCRISFIPYCKKNKFCSKECRKKYYQINQKEKNNRFLIFQRDGFKCRICGRMAKDGVQLNIDHWIPTSEGGTNKKENLITLCKECNVSKTNFLPALPPP